MKALLSAVIMMMFVSICSASILGDTNGDGKVDLAEALYALQVAAGNNPNLPESCVITMSGTWNEGENYIICDVVELAGNYYVASANNASTADNKPPNVGEWAVLAIQGYKGDTGTAGLAGTDGSDGATGPQGDKGDTGGAGLAGINGSDGATGPQGDKGDTGATGTSSWTDGTGVVSTSVNVSIGTSNPEEKLHVKGSAILEGAAGVVKLKLLEDVVGGPDGSGFHLKYDGNTNQLNFEEYSDSAYQSTIMTLDRNNMNVGIGTTSPVTTLDINGAMRLAKNSVEPFACDLSHEGSIALTSKFTTCACTGIDWVLTADGTTGCDWSTPPYVEGTVSLTSYGWGQSTEFEGFVFASESVVDYIQPYDFFIEENIIGLSDGVGGQHLGAGTLDGFTTAPTSGYGAGFSPAEIGILETGHVYAFKLADNTYALIEFTEVVFDVGGNGDYPTRSTFNYRYQPNGSNSF